MQKQQGKSTEETKTVDLISPRTGKVIPTVRWVADELIKKGWKRKQDEKTQAKNTKGEIKNGSKKK